MRIRYPFADKLSQLQLGRIIPPSRGACVAFAVRSGSGAALFGATLLGAVGQQQKKCCLEDPKAAQSIELDRNFGCFNIEIFRDSPIDLGDLGVP